MMEMSAVMVVVSKDTASEPTPATTDVEFLEQMLHIQHLILLTHLNQKRKKKPEK